MKISEKSSTDVPTIEFYFLDILILSSSEIRLDVLAGDHSTFFRICYFIFKDDVIIK